MPRLSPCVKCLFISFNIFFVIMGVLIVIISLALLSPSLDDLHGANDLEVQTTSRIVLYIVGSVTVVIAILGAYGAYKENRGALIVFLVCMVTGSLLMLRAGVSAAVARPKLESLTEERWRSFLPLNQASDDIKNQVEVLQTSLHCCGLFSYKDWGENIPKSCLCSQEEAEEGKCQTVNYGNFLLNYFRQKKSVFVQNCLPLIMDSVTTNANIKLAVVFTLFALALLGLVLSSLMIYQMSVPVMFIDEPPAYQQLYNLAECLDVGEAKTL
ncbi:tetraspanin-8-like [Siniperca chuatsi]|uniref:tetraspanin-8-like n=1 Tax=Siniperca chuatsi TaxID=119488 RepID=UPI001CE22A7D|nr:tetraspanin-8-like [Siniperca chuatsi]XP_044041319.1 tetraspanin-8-like [Siniperca chuatsi]